MYGGTVTVALSTGLYYSAKLHMYDRHTKPGESIALRKNDLVAGTAATADPRAEGAGDTEAGYLKAW